MIDSIDIVFYSACFLLPGYVISEMVSHFCPGREFNDLEKTIRCMGYSILELALWYWLLGTFFQKKDAFTYIHSLLFILILLGTSFITGIGIGIIKQNQLFRKLFTLLGIQTDHSAPTGWDYKFSDIKTSKWVCVCLDNDTFVRGRYGINSLASSEKNNHDIYLEEVYLKNSEGTWIKEEHTDGIWISANSIKWINFYKDEG